jgi:hypothetical protein
MTVDSHDFASTSIQSAEYESDSQTLTVEFVNGRVYELEGVPPEVWNAFKTSWSAGQFFNQNLRGRY